jgi:hypothetical protein
VPAELDRTTVRQIMGDKTPKRPPKPKKPKPLPKPPVKGA